MKMARWTLGAVLAGAAIFISCTYTEKKAENPQPIVADVAPTPNQSYGAYLAARVAHLRRDFDRASDYYIKAAQADPDNKELISRLYLLLVFQSRVDEAATYARQIVKQERSNNFAYTVIAVQNMHNGQYQDSIDATKKFDNPAYQNFIAPLLNAWNYVGLNDPDKALKVLAPLKKEDGFRAIYHFHAGMINDYFNRSREAQKNYEVLINEETMELSLRTLQVIANFYLRTDQKDKAEALVSGFDQEKAGAGILAEYAERIHKATPQTVKRLITTPNEGAAEALFSIAATFRYDEVIDVAHMFTSLAIYQNPDYDLAKLLLADILENREMYTAANALYDTISRVSPVYDAAQLKKADNLIKEQDYDSAELLLKSMTLGQTNSQIFLDLGDVLRMKNNPEEAVKYYKAALRTAEDKENSWVLYYAMGIAYEQSGEWNQAEKALLKALELSQNHYMVLNYLGYSWLKQKHNIDKAFTMIVNAYNQAPEDANISDSLGWALYNFGYYGMAEKYLEKAADAAPANAVISEHLGDVYWFTGRQNEARFQWQHALDLKDDSGEVDRRQIQAKLAGGIAQEPSYAFDKEIVEAQLKNLPSVRQSVDRNKK